MYGHFIQFTIPKIGQALVAVVLYLNFLKLPFVACFAGAHPAVYLLLPLLLLAVMSWIGRDPLGPGMIVNSHLTGLYIAGDVVGLLARAIGGTVQAAWQTIWMGGLLAWVGTAAMMLWSYFKAMRLVTNTYRLQTTKPLPGGKLQAVGVGNQAHSLEIATPTACKPPSPCRAANCGCCKSATCTPAKVPWTASASRS